MWNGGLGAGWRGQGPFPPTGGETRAGGEGAGAEEDPPGCRQRLRGRKTPDTAPAAPAAAAAAFPGAGRGVE